MLDTQLDLFFFFFSGFEIYASMLFSDKSQGKIPLRNTVFYPGNPQRMIPGFLQSLWQKLSGGGGWEEWLWDWWGLSGCVLCQSQSVPQSPPRKDGNPATVTAD